MCESDLIDSPDPRGLTMAVAMLVLIAMSADPGLHAQGLQNPETIDRIIGSEVQEEQVKAADMDRVIKAIEMTADNISTVRKATALDKIDIVFLTNAAASEGGPPAAISAKLEEHKEEIVQLRQELEANAMLYRAIDSRRIPVRDILALEFVDRDVVIYAATKPAN
ncbi:hypothetical protein [Mesorhizobium sp.]|uniref:hypothetical protein n=1 Tax=Mesorhizobium sp. TaxID=1871066 RepID=UPI000FE69B5F|nr:hypothetical protein [Mesorhizobium sp.]RWK60953.1 MAG: hypothetical protein EOR49_19545 [Mesorhizobium sp.]RWM46556.1 MAG: hypothetical protein EOR76_18220 [Mesorhizobium sp.]RWM50399.1 MAG: hypothetical protein EOR78_25745 [Mesorhizobium sp.]RWM55474.1 MAG: hypothetical protein EOR79_21180 [Mesorhizobium sp.]RWM77507.1 MAG: hypothetical protein EOR81_17240 [Mesorhizobium sp.]